MPHPLVAGPAIPVAASAGRDRPRRDRTPRGLYGEPGRPFIPARGGDPHDIINRHVDRLLARRRGLHGADRLDHNARARASAIGAPRAADAASLLCARGPRPGPRDGREGAGLLRCASTSTTTRQPSISRSQLPRKRRRSRGSCSITSHRSRSEMAADAPLRAAVLSPRPCRSRRMASLHPPRVQPIGQRRSTPGRGSDYQGDPAPRATGAVRRRAAPPGAPAGRIRPPTRFAPGDI